MSNYIEYMDKVAFHPGYYIKELVEESGLTQEDFAKRLDTTPKNLSILVRGEQSLSIDIAMKLSRISGTTISYWLNLQKAYDALVAEFESEKELEREKEIFNFLDYKYFKTNFGLKDCPGNKKDQIIKVREFLGVSTLSVLEKKNMAVSFRSKENISESGTVKANAMVQIATNLALEKKTPKYNKKKFEEAVKYALTQTTNYKGFYKNIEKAFNEAGVSLVVLPNIPGSNTNGATKKIGDRVMLMVNDRRLSLDSFWFTLFHEIGHVMNSDFGVSFEKEKGEQEERANRYARDMLIPNSDYIVFCDNKKYDVESIKSFANEIDRDPGIVLGRLQKDRKVAYTNKRLNILHQKFRAGQL